MQHNVTPVQVWQLTQCTSELPAHRLNVFMLNKFNLKHLLAYVSFYLYHRLKTLTIEFITEVLIYSQRNETLFLLHRRKTTKRISREFDFTSNSTFETKLR